MSRLWRSFRVTIAGRDPAAPWPTPKAIRVWGPLGVLALVGLLAITQRSFQDTHGLDSLMAGLFAVAAVAPLALMWRSPLWAWRVLYLALLVGTLDYSGKRESWPWVAPQVLIMLVALFVLALREPLGIVGWAGFFTVLQVWLWMPGNMAPGTTVLLVAVMALGKLIQRGRRLEQALEVADERGEVLAERARIARELHDVVAHSMSLVAVRAETAPFRLPDLPEAARAEFAALAGTARESLTELRQLLGTLRTEADPVSLRPQPTLEDLGELVSSARAAGMRVELFHFSGVPMPPATSLTIYRIVQEALSNAARHAPGSKVTVTVLPYNVEVVNGPSPAGSPSKNDGGHGLMGMRERVEMLGGTFEAGPTADGGFHVTAHLEPAR